MAGHRRAGSIRPHLAVIFLLLGVLLPLAFHPLPPQRPTIPPSSDAQQLLAALPEDLPPLRRAFVEHAASLLGQVDYFWGGKSDALGWDRRWGIPAVVSAPGSATSGTSRPFGLDCSGFVSWCAVNAAGDRAAFSAIGNGVRAQWAACTPVTWEVAQPGDLAVFPDLSHIGVVAGRGSDGALSVIHCSYRLGGVVCSADASAAGFTAIGRPSFYIQYKNCSRD